MGHLGAIYDTCRALISTHRPCGDAACIQDVERDELMVDLRYAFIQASNPWQGISFELSYRVSQCMPFLELAFKPWPTSCCLKISATYAGWIGDFTTGDKFVTACWHQNANRTDFMTWASRSFAMDACKNLSTNVTSFGGKKSFIITLYWLIQWSKTAFHSACGLQFLTTHVVVVTASPLGVYVDGYARDNLWNWILWYWLFDEQDDIVQELTEDEHPFATRVGGDPESKLKLSDTFHVQSCRS